MKNVHEFYSLVYPIIPSIRILVIAKNLVKEQTFGDERASQILLHNP
jgi:uncharacterized protein YqgC (DUF456 family)